MEKSNKYYKNINLIRVVACIEILLYHLNILKGGYLAVCTFFVLSGYLSVISAFKKEKFSLKSYYLNRLLKLYLPLIAVVFITIFAIFLFPNMVWLNIKPETTSVLAGYNNFWQISANLDYFARHVDSPFMHLWYIAILLQFDLVFPFIFIALKKLASKTKKIVPCIITIIACIISTAYFYKMSLSQNIMVAYYNTFARIFSLLFGVALGFIHSCYGALLPKKLANKLSSKIILYIYLLILICLCIFIDANSIYFAISMIIVTLISCRLIEYAIVEEKEQLSIYDKIIKSLAQVSYEIYLFQYPVIFIFQYIDISNYIKIPLIVIITLALSYILHFCIYFKNSKGKLKIVKYALCIIILAICLDGIYMYCISKDYSAEMEQLKNELAENEKALQKKQEEYENWLKQENDEFSSLLNDLENSEKELSDIVSNLPVVGIGDSVMLGAVQNLYQTFPNGYFDAKISRTGWVVNGIIQDLKNRNIFGGPVILNLGTNGDCPESCKIQIMQQCENKKVFWVTVTNDRDVHVNQKIISFANKYDNLYIVDWNSISSGHAEYFRADGIHLTTAGIKAYTQAVYDAIYQVYVEEYQNQKQELIKQHEEKVKEKTDIYENEISQ